MAEPSIRLLEVLKGFIRSPDEERQKSLKAMRLMAAEPRRFDGHDGFEKALDVVRTADRARKGATVH